MPEELEKASGNFYVFHWVSINIHTFQKMNFFIHFFSAVIMGKIRIVIYYVEIYFYI